MMMMMEIKELDNPEHKLMLLLQKAIPLTRNNEQEFSHSWALGKRAKNDHNKVASEFHKFICLIDKD